MDDLGIYTLTHPQYFETIARLPMTPAYSSVVVPLLSPDYGLYRTDLWLIAKPNGVAPRAQGFKIHLSCALEHGIEMLRRVVPICVREQLMFKFTGDPLLHTFMNSKRYSRGGSGKFFVIYPADDAQFLTLLETLHAVTRDLHGPYILSDRRYSSSRVVFYRYGGFERNDRLEVDGSTRPMIWTGDGALVQDQRLPYFSVPDWVVDPLPPDEIDGNGAADGSDLLNGRYEVTGALAISNTGGIYRAHDRQTGATVVIKEARPDTVMMPRRDCLVDARVALRHEQACLQRLAGVACVPQFVDRFEEWEHTFLVVEFFEGMSLQDLRAQEDFCVLDKIQSTAEGLERSCVTWRNIAIRVLEGVADVHAHGVIIGDISPPNILYNSTTGAIAIIDVEAARLCDMSDELTRFGSQWFYPGFRKQTTRDSGVLREADDFYACGMLLSNLLCPVQPLGELDPTYPIHTVLDHFIAGGLPATTKTIIEALLEGRADDALARARAWTPEAIAADIEAVA